MDAYVRSFFQFTRKGRLDKSINSLLGLLEGLAADGHVSSDEVAILRIWLDEHQDVAHLHPYSELVPRLEEAVADGHVSPDERDDLKWLCKRLRSTDFYDMVTADLQRLHGVVGGIASDGQISVEEMRGLSDWLAEHAHLQTCWPYDEIAALTTKVLSDGQIDAQEHRLLLDFFSDFLALLDERTVVRPLALDVETSNITALCAVAPEVVFRDRVFCFTGTSTQYPRSHFEDTVRRLGGVAASNVSSKVHFLVIGADGNPCWAFACYGRKVEKAVELRRKGTRIVLLHEHDFHDAVLDAA